MLSGFEELFCSFSTKFSLPGVTPSSLAFCTRSNPTLIVSRVISSPISSISVSKLSCSFSASSSDFS